MDKPQRDVVMFDTQDPERMARYIELLSNQLDYSYHKMEYDNGVFYVTVFLKTDEEMQNE